MKSRLITQGGSGLADWYCLTGDVDALRAAIDNVEQKDSEFRRHHNFTPGKTPVGSIRGFGRGFEVMMRVLQADPDHAFVRALCILSARTLWASAGRSRTRRPECARGASRRRVRRARPALR